jgi:hypothetical protein
VKTTLDLDDALLKKAKAYAAANDVSLTLLIEEGLRLRLRRQAATHSSTPPRLPVYKGGSGLAPGIDATSNRAMFEAAGDDA